MFTVLFITFSGMGIGYLVRKLACISYLAKSISWTIYILLFFFGLQVGSNDEVVANLDTLGVRALLIAVAGSLGSCVAAQIVYKFAFSNDSLFRSEGNAASKPYSGSSPGAAVKKIMQFMGGFVVVAFFVAGCICGYMQLFPDSVSDGNISMYVLYLLMIQVGISIGSDKRLKEILASITPKLLLLPAGTILGTLAFVAIASVAIEGTGFWDAMAIGAGFGYYSLSSVLITQIKEVSQGADFAAGLGTMALMANIMREVITLLFAPLIYKVFGKLAPISVGGATSMDSTLPVISAVCGKEMAFISIFHGVLVDFSVPFLVTFFASM